MLQFSFGYEKPLTESCIISQYLLIDYLQVSHRLKLLSVVVIGATVVLIAAVLLSDSEFVRIVKEVIYLLVKAGYEAQKIVQIINLYQ